ncbi:hypothetical protein TWF696_005067 [Orbilia brochopaga]|uniref:cysteine dioxygenase n=1 Tax=Orbilia brochopaga TaxID=3140254 RepID=A0AAV9UZK8_9PEZI
MLDAPHFCDLFSEDTGAPAHYEFLDSRTKKGPKPLMKKSPKPLMINGKGTIAIKSRTTQGVKFTVKPEIGYPMLILEITQSTVSFSLRGESEDIPLVPNVMSEGNPYVPAEELDHATEPQIQTHRLPVTVDLPPLVVTNELVSLRDLDLARVTTWANLPEACQKLYHNIVGKNIVLQDTSEFDFAAAIHHSVTTPGCWGYSKLLEKCHNDTNRFQYTYLRITIGSNLGNSPGIPYVMEIWPPGHKSPIHDHGDACAVIRVLYGKIQCTWYNSLGPDPIKLCNPATLIKDQITWLGNNQFQCHALENTESETCITLQCYEFPREDNVHAEKFRFIEATTNKIAKEPFIPNSDCTLTDFYDYMKAEWSPKNNGEN